MKKFCFLLIGFILFFSCTKEPKMTTAVPINDRLAFKSFEEFNDTYVSLGKFKSIDELAFWAQEKNHSTLLNSTDSTLTEYSDILKTILNKDSEFEIGDSIVLFNHGDLYTYSKKEANKISFTNNPEKLNKIGSIKVNVISEGSKEKSTDLSINSFDAKWQYEFGMTGWEYSCNNAVHGGPVCRKFVNEIVDETVYDYYVYYSHLYIRIKMEWKTCPNGTWRPATELREVHVHILGSAYWYPGGFGGGCGQNADFSCTLPLGPVNGALMLPLMNAAGAAIYYPYWTVSLTGSISQYAIGDSNPAWVISGNLW